MVRCLLIALLAMVALALPAAAQVPGLPSAPRAAAPAIVDAGPGRLCVTDLCRPIAPAPPAKLLFCQYYQLNWPGPEQPVTTIIQVDPDGCLGQFVDRVLPPTTKWVDAYTVGQPPPLP